MASDDPVLPPVYSITRMPGFSVPRRSAPSIIASAIRSLYEPVGLKYSSLTTTSAESGWTRRCRRTTGVEPIVLSTELTGAVKDEPRVGGGDEPGLRLDLPLELAGGPA